VLSPARRSNTPSLRLGHRWRAALVHHSNCRVFFCFHADSFAESKPIIYLNEQCISTLGFREHLEVFPIAGSVRHRDHHMFLMAAPADILTIK
jgi:hypothetical protein